MSRIVSIAWEKPPVFIVKFDNGHITRFHSKIVWDFGLEVGMDVSRELFIELASAAIRLRLHETALKALSYRDYSAREMRERLSEDSRREELIDAEIEHLKDEGLLDDERLAERLANKYVHVKKYGYKRALRELVQHGIDRFTAEDALQSYDEEFSGNIRTLLETKHARYLTDPSDRKSVNKVRMALLRYGYDPAEVKLALNEYFEDDNVPEGT